MAVVAGALSLTTVRTIVLSQPSGHKAVTDRPSTEVLTDVLNSTDRRTDRCTEQTYRSTEQTEVLTDHPPSGSSIDPASVAV